jgi:hypothetical protein
MEAKDKRSATNPYQEGDLIWLFMSIVSTAVTQKLASHWKGPYRVISVTSPSNIKIQHLLNKNDIQVVNIARIKRYYGPLKMGDKNSNAEHTHANSREGMEGINSSVSPVDIMSDEQLNQRIQDITDKNYDNAQLAVQVTIRWWISKGNNKYSLGQTEVINLDAIIGKATVNILSSLMISISEEEYDNIKSFVEKDKTSNISTITMKDFNIGDTVIVRPAEDYHNDFWLAKVVDLKQ